MKYRNFLNFIRNNADLSWLAEHVGPPQLREWPNIHVAERRAYVEGVLKFVDIRDFLSLDTAAPLSFKKEIVTNGHRNPSREETRYVIRYHTGGRTCALDPIRTEKVSMWDDSSLIPLPNTLGETLGNFLLWLRRRQDFQPVILDAVVKVTRIWDGDWDRYSSESVEIYRFPEHLRLQSVWLKDGGGP